MNDGIAAIIRPWGTFFDEAAAAAEGTPNSLLGNEGGQPAGETPQLPEGAFLARDFKSALPEDLRNHDSLAKVSDLEGMARSFVAAQQMIGKDPARSVELPGADATMEQLGPIFDRLGAPANPGDFKFQAPEGLPPEAVSLETPLGKAFVASAHKHKLHPLQAQGVYADIAVVLGSTIEEQSGLAEQTHMDNVAKFEAMAGAAKDEWLRAANFAVEKLGGNDLRSAIDEAGLGTNPHVLAALAKVGQIMGERTGVSTAGGESQNFGSVLAPAEAKARAKQLLGQAHATADVAEKRRLSEEAQKFFEMAVGKDKITSPV